MTDRDFTIDTSHADRAVFRGVMRLESVEAYDRVLAGVRAAMTASPLYTLDVRDLVFLNSSGIRAVGEILLRARDEGRKLRIVAAGPVPWQKKTLASLGKLYPGLEVSYEDPT